MTATPPTDEQMLDEAEDWHRVLERDDADWDAYTRWLEADPSHRAAFDAVALGHRIVDERLDDLRAEQASAAVEQPPVARSRWVYGTIAAGLALAVGVASFWARPADTVYETARGQTRQVALGAGVTADLAPATRIVAQGGDVTHLELASGDVVFTVVHDPARQLSIKAGDYVVRDIGTTFGMNVSQQTVTVAVAEGRLTVAADGGQATAVSAGQQLIAPRSGGTLRLGVVDSRDVGSWRQGRLVYSDTPLAVVVADISRYSGKTTTVDPTIGGQSFSGVLAIGDGSKLLADLAEIVDVPYTEAGNHARLGAGPAR